MSAMTFEPWPPKRTRPVGPSIERPQRLASGGAVGGDGLVESWMQNHAGNAMDAGRWISGCDGLLDGARGAADDVLILFFNPEMRRVVCEVGENCDERATGKRGVQALAESEIEMRNEGHDHFGRSLAPVFGEHLDRRAMIGGDSELQDSQQLRAAKSPARGEHLVVEVLDANAREFSENIESIEQLLQIQELNVPGKILGLNGHLERCGRAAMSAAGVEEDELDSFHQARHCGTRCSAPC